MAQGDGFIMNDDPPDRNRGTGLKLPKIDFSSFILSLYSSVLVQLGKIEDPGTGKQEKDLELAKHSIDIIAMLEEKTAGNLDKDEASLIKALLSEIRLAYVEAKG